MTAPGPTDGAPRPSRSMQLGRVGIWTRQLDSQPSARAQDHVAELETLGYKTIWIPEAIEREVISHASLLLAGSSTIVVATGIARTYSRDASAAALAQLLLCERYPGRFLLGLGVSHRIVVERFAGTTYGPPLDVMRDYLQTMDAVLHAAHPVMPAERPERVLAALGPKMLRVAAEQANGAHTYLSPVGHTRWARGRLGAEPRLIPCVKAVLDTSVGRGRDVGRASIGATIGAPAYLANLMRVGFTEDDVGPNPSDVLVDALVAHGDVDTIISRVSEHLDAGADHVCLEVLTGDDTTVPIDTWRALAPALSELEARDGSL
jgi:probable F420-dependent oxidoreductase